MKFNKWTLGLAAVGVVSLASAARADEKMSTVNTALSTTTLSGYVDVGAQYASAGGGAVGGIATAGGAAYGPTVGGANSFSLNVVDIALDKPLDATPFSAGYHVELWAGPGATANFGSTTGIRQAYLALGTTIGGQEIDWKIGMWDTIIGYEGLTSSANPNYTHSYGFAIEPTSHTGIQANYKVNDSVSLQAGIADDSVGAAGYSPAINGSGNLPLQHPSLMGAVALTAPDSFGPLAKATLTIGGINTPVGAAGGFTDSLYVGATIPTSNSALTFGGAFDYADSTAGHIWVAGIYGTYKASDKLTFNVRAETFDQTGAFLDTITVPAGSPFAGTYGSQHGEELTATASYQLWANVLSRVEVRWDHADDGVGNGGPAPFVGTSNGGSENNALLLAAQLIYSF